MDRSIRRVDNVRMKADSSIITRRGLKTIGSKGTTTGFSMMMNSYARTLNKIAKYCPKTIKQRLELRGFLFKKKTVYLKNPRLVKIQKACATSTYNLLNFRNTQIFTENPQKISVSSLIFVFHLMDRSIRRVDNVRMKADSSIITRRGLKTIGSKGTTTGFSMMMNSYARTLNEIAKFCPKTKCKLISKANFEVFI